MGGSHDVIVCFVLKLPYSHYCRHEVSEDERKWRCGVTDDDQHQHYHDGAGEKIRENKDGHNKGDLPEDLLNFLSASRARLLSSKPVEEHEHRRLLADPLWVELFVVSDKLQARPHTQA
jgi:hypothetical protein